MPETILRALNVSPHYLLMTTQSGIATFSTVNVRTLMLRVAPHFPKATEQEQRKGQGLCKEG